MKFAHVTISVKNLNESLSFYQDIIGLPIKRRFPAGGSEIVFLGNEGTEIELIHNPARPNASFGDGISLGFEVPSVDAVVSLLKQKGIAAGEMLKPTPYVKFFFITDPNGVRIQFLENVK